MNHVTYHRPERLEDALELLDKTRGIAPMAGGTDLVVQMRHGRLHPDAILDLSGLDLSGVRKEKSTWHIKAGTTMTQLIEAVEEGGVEALELVSKAAQRLGAHQIQNRATIGGNICNASPAGDAVCALTALCAVAVVQGKGGKRSIPFSELFKGPGETVLRPDELLLEVEVPEFQAPKGVRVVHHYFKVGGRSSLVCAICSLAAVTVMRGDEIVSSTMALGSVAPIPWKAKFPQHLLEGKNLTEALVDTAAKAARDEVSPIDDVRASRAYRRDVVQALVAQHLVACSPGS